MRAAAITPAERSVLASLASRPMPAFPVKLAGRLPHCWFRGLRSVHFALQPAWSLGHPRRPFCIEVLQTMSLPPSSAPTVTGWSDSCRAGFAPAEKWRLVTAHNSIGTIPVTTTKKVSFRIRSSTGRGSCRATVPEPELRPEPTVDSTARRGPRFDTLSDTLRSGRGCDFWTRLDPEFANADPFPGKNYDLDTFGRGWTVPNLNS